MKDKSSKGKAGKSECHESEIERIIYNWYDYEQQLRLERI